MSDAFPSLTLAHDVVLRVPCTSRKLFLAMDHLVLSENGMRPTKNSICLFPAAIENTVYCTVIGKYAFIFLASPCFCPWSPYM